MVSVLEQGAAIGELIVVDDASSDATAEVVAEVHDPRVHYLCHTINRGGQAARNTGIRAASGEWIAFLDSDDYWLPDSFRLRMDKAERCGVDVVHSAALVTYDGVQLERFAAILPCAGQVYRELLGEPGPMFQGLLVRKAALEQIGLLDEGIIAFQEWDTAIRLARRFAFAFSETPGFVYDCSGADAMSKDPLKDVDGYKQIVARHRRDIVAECGRRALARHFRIIGLKYLTIGMRRYGYPYLACARVMSRLS